jgi:hypothetical protein
VKFTLFIEHIKFIMKNFCILFFEVFLLFLPVSFVSASGEINTNRIMLNNDRFTLLIGKDVKGAIVSLIDNSSGVEFISPQSSPHLFNLAFSKKSETGSPLFYLSSLDAKSFSANLKNGEITLLYNRMSEYPVEVTCTAYMSKKDKLVHWNLSVNIPESLILEEVQFPIVGLKTPLGGNAADDAAFFGHTKGGVIQRPAELKNGTRFVGILPGTLAAQFGCYYDNRAGFYTAAYDNKGYPKVFEMVRMADGVQMEWKFKVYKEKSYTMDFDAVMSTFNGTDNATPADWRDAADIYKTWALQQKWCATPYAQRKDIPAWMKNGPAMVRFGRDWLAEPQRIMNWLNNYWKRSFPEDIPLITAYWGWEKVAPWVTPDYFPVFPSNEQFTDLVARSRKLGCHAFPWPSGYNWTLTYDKKEDGSFYWDDRKRFDEVARTHAVYKRDGQLKIKASSWLKGGETACMCPGDPWTINWWNKDICEPLIRMGCDMIQVDQVFGEVFYSPPPVFFGCYSRSHNHSPGPGLWMTEVFTKQLETMLASIRKIEPEAVVCYEQPNEFFNHFACIQDYRDCESRRDFAFASNHIEWASAFNYIYHEFLPAFQSNPRAGDNVMTGYCLVNGQMPHMRPSAKDTIETVPSPESDLMQRWIRLYHGEGRPWLQFGKMLHPPKLACDTVVYDNKVIPVILHNAFRSPDGIDAIVLVNTKQKPEKATMYWKNKEIQLHLKPFEVMIYTDEN